MAVLYTAKVTVRSGRDGAVRSEDGALDARLAFPASMGGDGRGTNPEQLFGAGFAACFGSSLAHVARAAGTALSDLRVDAEVDILVEGERFDLAARLTIHAAGVDRQRLAALVEQTRVVCPYARLTRDRITTQYLLGE